jgi:hypothetical protein
MRTTMVGAVAVVTLFGAVPDAEARCRRCGKTADYRVHYRAAPASL